MKPVTCLSLAVIALALPVRAADPGTEISFGRDVRPILSDHCFACHGPDQKTREADLRLDTETGAFADLGGYHALVPGAPEKSEAIQRITTDDRDDLMPPKKFKKPLNEEEIRILREWVRQGANWEMHWAYRQLERPLAPQMEDPEFVRNDIDRFIRTAQEKHGLSPSGSADRISLIRRLYLDLTGLPPSPEEVDTFVNNPTPTAYEDLVDRLLKSKHFGERMAIYWLDLVRYADTIGYHSDNPMEVSAFRDYVIDAFNRNLPYDRFTIEQLAGDLLPDPSRQQRVASGYNRLLQTTEEGGAQPKEYMAIYAADRVRNVSEVWLGSTMGCAQCHDHKYDPFTMKDFYSMAAFFSDISEKPNGRRVPNLKLPTPAEEAEKAALNYNLAKNSIPEILAVDPVLAEQVATARSTWELGIRKRLEKQAKDWTVITPSGLRSVGGQELKTQPDGSVLSGGRKNPNQDNFMGTLHASGLVTGLRLEALTDPSMAKQSLSRGNGNFVLTGVDISHGGQPLEIARAEADYEQPGHPVTHAIDADPKTGWAGNGHVETMSRTAVFVFAEPVDLGEGGELTFGLRHQSDFTRHAIGRFRLSVARSASPVPSGGIDIPLDIQEILKIAPSELSSIQWEKIITFHQSITPELAPYRGNLDVWKKRIAEIDQNVQTMLVSDALSDPRMIRILPRGNWLDESGEVVEPALPAFLAPATVEGHRPNRLDLASWITDESNPLTARAFANRLWKLFFGTGLSKDLNDLGGQGQPPSHPELLDWLAVEFRESGWDVKHLIKTMVMSGAYRQSSVPTPNSVERDPSNTWLSRQNRWRIEAELVRDVALDLSGLLVKDLGGKSVKPYQPAGYWQHLNFPKREWQADQAGSLYRRGLYTFWCRTFLHPAMLTFDAPSREECTAERPRSNTPQQALVLLNDPVFVEASRVFAQNIARQPGEPAARVAWAWKKATGREPSTNELKILADLFADQRAHFANKPESAAQLIAIGEFPAAQAVDAGELAAWTQVARTILNAYETTSRN